MKLKRFLSLLLVVMMLAAMFVTSASADDATGEGGDGTVTPAATPSRSTTITVNDTRPNRTYYAYQVFSGSLANTGILSDIQWGADVNGDGILNALKTTTIKVDGKDVFMFRKAGSDTNAFADCTTAADVADVITKWPYNETDIKNFADIVSQNLKSSSGVESTENGPYIIDVSEPLVTGTGENRVSIPRGYGYYLVMDKTTGNTTSHTDYLLQVSMDEAINIKNSEPSFTKYVNSTLNGTYTNAIAAHVGETVYFKLEAKLPSGYNDYKQYILAFTDELPDGLVFNKLEGVYVEHDNGEIVEYTSKYAFHTEQIEMTRQYAQKYYVETASGEKANTADQTNDTNLDGKILTINCGDLKRRYENPNLNDKFVIKYSAIVTSDAVYGLNEVEGNTTTKTYTYGNTNKATMYASNNMNQQVTDYEVPTMTTITDHAHVYTYQLEVTKIDSATKLPLDDAEFRLYRNVSVNVSTSAESGSATGSLKKEYATFNNGGVITGWIAEDVLESATDAVKKTTILTSGDKGTFMIKGLGAMTYRLEEVKAPDGYNTMKEPVQITIHSAFSDHYLTSLTCEADSTAVVGDIETGLLSIQVKNTAGTQLPETGGTGTTIFYVAGAALLVAVAVVLVTKKRRDA